MHTLHEPARDIPVLADADLCVIGGSCTGVFAAVRAARLGLRVTLIEQAGGLGGVATTSLVNVWHSPLDTEFRKPILAGLTVEVMDRLRRRNAVQDRPQSPHWAWAFNPSELMIELDELVREAKIDLHLHTRFVAPWVNDGKLQATIIENKSGRSAIRARIFIDATGDGDVAHRLNLPTHMPDQLQPSTTCAIISGWNELATHDLGRLVREHGAEFNLPPGFAWSAPVPGTPLHMLAGTRVHHENCAEARSLTAAEVEGRRQVRAMLDLARKYAPEASAGLVALPARLGIRQTRHIRAQYQLTGEDVLTGRRFPDAIANGSYRVDIHHQDKPGITLRYLDGHEEYVQPGHPVQNRRWHPETATNPTFYQIPYRCLMPGTYANLLMAGRMIDTDPQAHAAVRVMVNMNQTGEAAGVAAWLALDSNRGVADIDIPRLRATLTHGGSIML